MPPLHTGNDQAVVEELLEEKQEETPPAAISPVIVTAATAATGRSWFEEKYVEVTHDPLDHDQDQFAVGNGTAVISAMKSRLDRQFFP